MAAVERALAVDHAWIVEADGEEPVMRVRWVGMSRSHELAVRAAEIDGRGNGVSTVCAFPAKGGGESLHLEVALRSGRADASELSEALRRLY